MLKLKSRHRGAFATGAIVAFLQTTSTMAATSDPAFFDAALCNPPYSMTSATAIYDAAEKVAKPDTSSLGTAIYKIPQQIGRDGFKSDEVFFAGSAVGILIQGLHADELAAKYDLKPETSDLLGASGKGYAFPSLHASAISASLSTTLKSLFRMLMVPPSVWRTSNWAA